MEAPEKNRSEFWKELLKLAVISIIIVVPFRLYVAQPFIVDGLSMYPTFDNGEYLIIDEISYRFEDPERGEVLVFKYPKDPSKYFIKRIIGLPNETVTLTDGKVTIKGNTHPDDLVLEEPYVKMAKSDNLTFTLGEGEYFVMGDNRLQSADSRLWGSVPKANLIGRPFLRFIPPALFPGKVRYAEASTNLTE